MTDSPLAVSRRGARITVAVAGLLVLVKLILSRALLVQAIPGAGHDDALFLSLARSLQHGHWLGPYDRLTLAKGPFYPMWIAVVAALRLPLLAAQQALYAIACAVFVRALWPVLRRPWAALGIFAVLLFQPGSVAEGPNTRVLREGIYPALTLLAMGVPAGAAIRLALGRERVGWWAAGAGLSVAAFWLTREEGAWIVPALALVAAGPWLWRLGPRPAWRGAAVVAVIATATFGAAWCSVAAKNGWKYGAFLVTEFTGGGFPLAYGALVRIEHPPRRYVPVPASVRAQAYAASPAFSALAPSLEEGPAHGWIAPGCTELKVCDDFAGGWFMWALREAAWQGGHLSTGHAASAYWTRIASDLDAACKAGRLRCGPPRTGFMTPLRSEDLAPLVRTWGRGALFLARLDEIASKTRPSFTVEHGLGDYPAMTHERIAVGAAPRRDARLALLQANTAAWRVVLPVALAAALVAWALGGLASLARWRRPTVLWWLGGALLIAVAVRLVVVSIVDYTSFPGITVGYLAPAYPLVAAFASVVLVDAVTGLGRRGSPPGASGTGLR